MIGSGFTQEERDAVRQRGESLVDQLHTARHLAVVNAAWAAAQQREYQQRVDKARFSRYLLHLFGWRIR